MAIETSQTRDTCWDPFAGFMTNGWKQGAEAHREEPDEAVLEQIEAALAPIRGGLPLALSLDPLMNSLAVTLGRILNRRRVLEARPGAPV